jgi:hypothetical protein
MSVVYGDPAFQYSLKLIALTSQREYTDKYESKGKLPLNAHKVLSPTSLNFKVIALHQNQ